MKIVCATNMPYAMEAFSTLGETVVLEGRHITAKDVKDADILALRSTTQVTRELLEGSRVRFVGTATIGTDHFDIPYFEKAGIRWCYAPGCNANSVSEYVTTALLCLAHRHGSRLAGKTIGVVGVGNVGRRVVQKAEALGLTVLQNDPPRKDATGDSVFLPLADVIRNADILTLHVPLTKGGAYPTVRMANRALFEALKPGCLFFNAARGGVVETDSLLQALDAGIVAHTVLDTWEGEPAFRVDMLDRADIGTPHIAGHSFEGKVNGTLMVYREACRFLGIEPTWSPEKLLPPPLVPEVTLDAADRDDEALLWDLVRRVYDIEADDLRMRSGNVKDDASRARHFDRLRTEYPIRREFPFTEVKVKHSRASLERTLSGVGFSVRRL